MANELHAIRFGNSTFDIKPLCTTFFTDSTHSDNASNANFNGDEKPSKYPFGLSVNTVYSGVSTGWPYDYGNALTIKGMGTTQLMLSWNASQTTDNPNVSQSVYIRSQRDSAGDNWSKWTRLMTDDVTYDSTTKRSANTVLAGPKSGNSAAASFRKLVAADIPSIASSKVSALTGYTSVSAATDLATTDTLNSALAKLEYKAKTAYNWYKDVSKTDSDGLINKWDEIVGFLGKVAEGTDITDEFVTRKTDQEITGKKSFTNAIKILDGKDLILHGRTNDTNDPGDIAFSNNAGTELARLFVSYTDDAKKLNLRWDADNNTIAEILHTKNISKSTVGLGNVENTKLSTWAGSSNLTTCKQGTFGAAATYGVTTSITNRSNALITSGAVYTGLAGKADATHYHSKSEITDFAHTHDYIPNNPNSIEMSGMSTQKTPFIDFHHYDTLTNDYDYRILCKTGGSGVGKGQCDFEGITNFKGNVLTHNDNTYDLGTSSKRWKTVYAYTFSGTATYAMTAGSASASDVYAWAKAATKPSYKTSEVAEKTNLYFTNQRAIDACSGTYMLAGDTSHGTHVTNGAQTWSGTKTFSSEVILNGGGTQTDICSGIAAAFKTKRIMANQIITDSIILGASSGTASNKNLTIQKYGKITSTAPDALTTLLTFDTKGRIRRTSGGSWISARDNTIIMQEQTSNSGASYNPIIGAKTQVGFWSMGSCGGETLYLSYDTDENYNAGTNTSASILFPEAGSTGTIALIEQIPTKVSQLTNDSGYITSYTDTKNTTGTTNKASTKLFLAGATSQADNPQTYSNSSCYIGTDNTLYSGDKRTITGLYVSGDSRAISDRYGDVTLSAGDGITISLDDDNTIRIDCDITDTDTKVKQSSLETTGSYPILMAYSTSPTSGTANQVYYNTGAYINPLTKYIYSSGFFETSDANLKNFISDIDVDLDKIKQLPKKYFTWKDGDQTLHIGTSAQEVQKIYPELVSDSDGTLTVDYAKLSVVALAAIDKLVDKQKELEDRLAKLEAIVSKLTE